MPPLAAARVQLIVAFIARGDETSDVNLTDAGV
jgi:hypothetical protein